VLPEANLKNQVQAIGKQVQLTVAVLQPFQVAIVSEMVHSALLATAVTGGVRLRATRALPGTGP